MNTIYAADGVNIEAGDDLSAIAAKLSRSTWEANPEVAAVKSYGLRSFRGPRTIRYNLDPAILKVVEPTANTDGVGTKVGIDAAAHAWANTGSNLLAMLADDTARYGGLPVYLTNDLSVSSTIHHEEIVALLTGLTTVSKEHGIIVFNGEIAELGQFIGGNDPLDDSSLRFHWSGTINGLIRPDRLITGETVEAGDVVIALQEKGFRSNGISSVRKAFEYKFGPEWFRHAEALPYIKEAAAPSIVYTSLLSNLNGWYEEGSYLPIKHVAHITGGGIPSKFGRELLQPLGLSAVLDNLFKLPAIMRQCAMWREMDDQDLYKTWNGGQGMLLTVAYRHAEQVLKLAEHFGLRATVAGEIYRDDNRPVLRIHSKLHDREIVFPMS